MKQVYKIDSEGFYVEPVILSEGEELPSDCVEVAIPEGLYKAKFDGTAFVEGLTQLEIDTLSGNTLDQLKEKKINELDEACNLAIINGFDYTIDTVSYHFSCSLSAQANFQGTDTLFKDGAITQAEWTVVDNATGKIERILIDNATFNAIKLEVFKHINSNVSQFRNTLQPQVEDALTKEEVASIVW
jgi:hypothetical protein